MIPINEEIFFVSIFLKVFLNPIIIDYKSVYNNVGYVYKTINIIL